MLRKLRVMVLGFGLAAGAVVLVGCDSKDAAKSGGGGTGAGSTADKMKGAGSKYAEAMKEGAEKAKEGAEKVGEKVKEGAEKVGDKVKEGAEKVKDAAGDLAAKAKEGATKLFNDMLGTADTKMTKLAKWNILNLPPVRRCFVMAGRWTPNSSANAFCVNQTVSSFRKTSTFTAPSGAV